MGPEVACLDAVSSAEHPRAPPQLSGPPVSRKDLSMPRIPATRQAPSPARGDGGAAPLGQGCPPRRGWWGWYSTSLLSEVSKSPPLATPGGGSLEAGPEAKLMYTSGDGETHALKQPVSDWKSYTHSSRHAAHELKRPVKAKTSSCCNYPSAKIPQCRQGAGKTCLVWTF